MCGRYAQTKDPGFLSELMDVDEIITDPLPASYNVAPTDQVYAVDEKQGVRRLDTMRWGLIPHWAKTSRGPLNINARSETVAQVPTFRTSFRRKRCLIPADGFFEWGPKQQGRRPHYVTLASGQPMIFAGLWSAWKDPQEEWIKSCAIITTCSNSKLATVHTRMPVILSPENWDLWLDDEITEPAALQPLLTPLPEELITHYPVSNLVNSVRNDSKENVAPLRNHRKSTELFVEPE